MRLSPRPRIELTNPGRAFKQTHYLLPSLATDLAELIRRCPTATWLVSSRERLRIRAERTYPLEPLAPEDAASLFVACAGDAGTRFEQDDDVLDLCEHLDRLPLAIELAAARSPLFTPAQLVGRLTERLDLLQGAQDVESRHHTLRATIDWSYDLLTPEEQELFRRFSVLVGSASYEAAEHVCDANPETMQSLIDKSLVRQHEAGDGRRYRMLETVRQYASERLASAGEWEGARQAHRDWVLEHVRAHAPAWARPADPAVIARLFEEEANILTAIDRAIVASDTDIALELVGLLGRAWLETGRLDAAGVISNRALELPGGSAVLRAGAEMTCGWAALTSGSDLAIPLFESASEAYAAASKARELAWATQSLGLAVAESGQIEDGLELVNTAIDQLEEIKDDAGVRVARGNVIHVMRLRPVSTREEEARLLSLCRELVDDDRRHGDPYDLVVGLHQLADLLIDAGEPAEAWDPAIEALAISTRIGMRNPEDPIALLARCATRLGDWKLAMLLVGAHDHLQRTSGRQSPSLDSLAQQAEAALGSEEVNELISQGSGLSLDDLLERLPPGDRVDTR